jgi:hypothetical protein
MFIHKRLVMYGTVMATIKYSHEQPAVRFRNYGGLTRSSIVKLIYLQQP